MEHVLLTSSSIQVVSARTVIRSVRLAYQLRLHALSAIPQTTSGFKDQAVYLAIVQADLGTSITGYASFATLLVRLVQVQPIIA